MASRSGTEVTQFTGRVVGVTDGDTIKVLSAGREVKVRLNGIDCPEKRQPFGARAKQFTSTSVFGKMVTVIVTDVDHYGRSIGDVLLPDGQSLNRELVSAGLAWWYDRYSNDDEDDVMASDEVVTISELVPANTAELDALVELLARKGLISKAELFAEIRAMKERRLGEGRPGSV